MCNSGTNLSPIVIAIESKIARILVLDDEAKNRQRNCQDHQQWGGAQESPDRVIHELGEWII